MSSLDLRSGYFPLAVNLSDVVKTAFVTKNGAIIIRGVKLAEFNIGWGHRSGTKNAVADILPKNPVESSAAENVACAIIRDMRLSSREQLTEE
ncbi:hypothetical protein TNCV_3875001 [Trichonephila clavipes]|nr:hypothetical protein TNCV_3875001 [Trichonephila clavipes]